MADPKDNSDQSRRARYAAGKALRRTMPREQLAAFDPGTRDPIAILQAGDSQRIAALVPVRYERMAVSPFTFLRGAAAVMAVDLAALTPIGINAQACGDCHLMNFGVFATPEDNVLFDINDFDETLPGVDISADLRRLAASVVVASQAAGLSDKKARLAARDGIIAYHQHIRELALLSPLQIWHSRIELAQQIASFGDPRLAQRLRAILLKADRELDSDDNFPHLVGKTTTTALPRIADKPPTIYHFEAGNGLPDVPALFAAYRAALPRERAVVLERYRLVDHAIKVVGVGSVGTFCAIGLFMSGDGEPLFLQIKQAQKSVLEPLAPNSTLPSLQGERVIAGQRIMQAAADIFLGSAFDETTGKHFYVRQLKNRRLGSLGELLEGDALPGYARLCGKTLARAHARSSDPAMIAGYLGKSEVFADALAGFGMAYAVQTISDHAKLAAIQPAVQKRKNSPGP